MDCFEEKGLGSTDRSNREYPDPDFDGTKSCASCGTQKTPLWRAGPSGPKSLCNACGIRYRKRERSVLGLKVEGKEKKRKERGRMGVSFKGFGHRRWAVIENQNQGMLLPEEEAAVLLMALSSGLLCSSSKERSRERQGCGY